MTAPAGPLQAACTALWSATLSLMVAFMQNPAPAHRLLLARRITANLRTLAQQEVFAGPDRESFARLQLRWHATAQALADPGSAERGRGLLGTLIRLRTQRL